uniref:Uncharacterized protein n=1 Tax=Anguilla anguilla TaxID=7936 RepID=A0A0E9USE6_ANGAN
MAVSDFPHVLGFPSFSLQRNSSLFCASFRKPLKLTLITYVCFSP